jgi:hypothetical protein
MKRHSEQEKAQPGGENVYLRKKPYHVVMEGTLRPFLLFPVLSISF